MDVNGARVRQLAEKIPVFQALVQRWEQTNEPPPPPGADMKSEELKCVTEADAIDQALTYAAGVRKRSTSVLGAGLGTSTLKKTSTSTTRTTTMIHLRSLVRVESMDETSTKRSEDHLRPRAMRRTPRSSACSTTATILMKRPLCTSRRRFRIGQHRRRLRPSPRRTCRSKARPLKNDQPHRPR